MNTKVLIVEDEIVTAMALQENLKSLGYQVLPVEASGEKAIEKAKQLKPNIILMDIQLNGKMDGVSAADAIRGSQEIPIIFITAFADADTLSRAKKTMPYAYLIKPIQPYDLKVAIEIALYLHEANDKRKKAEYSLRKKTYDLGERVKELNCLYGISELIEQVDLSPDEILQGIVNLIPCSWQYPDITCSRLFLGDQVFSTKGFSDTKWKQISKIQVNGQKFGKLEVYYQAETPEIDEGPFLKEERSLIDAIAARIGKVLERFQAEENLKKAMQQLQEQSSRLKDENIYLQEEIKLTHNFSDIISKNKSFLKILRMTEKVAASKTTVLVLGETGTGKELIARVLHDLSDRKDYPLVKVNCAALPANLIESELFGHEKGAFTGAITHKKGRFELANKGTIFLDEIGDLPMMLQSKLLRVLQEGEFERVGGTTTLKINVRVLAATNQNLELLASKGKFRSDLFYRLNVFPIECPPLRDRKDDIPLLANHFVKIFNKKVGKNIEIVSSRVIDILQNYNWPGNIRELENIIERSVILSSGNELKLGAWLSKNTEMLGAPKILSLDETQKKHINYVLKLTNGKISGEGGAAKLLGINRATLQSRMKKLGVKVNKTTAEISSNAE